MSEGPLRTSPRTYSHFFPLAFRGRPRKREPRVRSQPAPFLGSPTIWRTHLWPHHTPLGQGAPLLLKRLADELMGGQRNRQGVRENEQQMGQRTNLTSPGTAAGRFQRLGRESLEIRGTGGECDSRPTLR